MMKEQKYAGDTDQKNLQSMLEAAEKELALADDIMQKSFETASTLFNNSSTSLTILCVNTFFPSVFTFNF